MAVATRKVVVELHEDLLAQCSRLAEAPSAMEGGVGGLKVGKDPKKLGGEGSGGVVFTAENPERGETTVVKCGGGDNLEVEGNALKMLADGDVEGVVRQLGMEKKEGLWLLELEFLARSAEWAQCLSHDQKCVSPDGEACSGGECFPACAPKSKPLLDAPITYAVARELIRKNVVAFNNLCQIHFSQMDCDSGFNTMITADSQVKLIDFEKGLDIGSWSGGLWCDHDLNSMDKRIAEVTRCLAEGDPFRVQATAIGKELREWRQSKPQQLYKQSDPQPAVAAAAAEAQQLLAGGDDGGTGTVQEPAAGSILARIDALPVS